MIDTVYCFIESTDNDYASNFAHQQSGILIVGFRLNDWIVFLLRCLIEA